MIIIVGVLVGCSCPASAQGQSEIADICAAWNARQDQFDTIRFTIEGEVFTPKGFKGNAGPESNPSLDPPEDHRYPTKTELKLDLAGGRVYRRLVKEIYNVPDANQKHARIVYPYDQQYYFTGAWYKEYQPLELNDPAGRASKFPIRELHIRTKQDLPMMHYEHCPLLYSLGLVLVEHNYYPHELKVRLQPRHFQKSGEVTLDGRRCLVLHVVPNRLKYYEYVVDAEPPYLVREARTFRAKTGQLGMSMSIQHQETEHGVFPATWQVARYFSVDGAPETYDMRLVDYAVNPELTDADFDVDPPPGTSVYDERRPPDSRTYVIGNDQVPEVPLAEYQMQEEARKSRNWNFLILFGVVAVAVGAIFWWRRSAA